jgi:hypothetical protein
MVFKRAKRGGGGAVGFGGSGPMMPGGPGGGAPMGGGAGGPGGGFGGGFGGTTGGFGGQGGGFAGTTGRGLGSSSARGPGGGGVFGSSSGGTTGTTAGKSADGDTLVIRLKHANAADLAAVLDTLYAGSGKASRFVAVPATNTLLVSGNPGIISEVRKLIDTLDAADADSAVPTRPSGSGTSPAPRSGSSNRPGGPRGGGSGTSSSTGTSGSGSTTGTADASGSTTDKREFAVVQLKYAKAEDIARVLTELFAGNSRLRVIAEASSNSLVIQGSTSDVETVRALLEKLDGLAPDTGRKR